MPPVPILRPSEVIRGLEKFGWSVTRQSGSHIILTKAGQMATLSVPNHATVARGTLRTLLRAANISLDEFLRAI